MGLFHRETPRHFYPPGADPTLDRPIPQKARGLPCMVIAMIVMVVLFAAVLLLMNHNASAKQVVWVTETPGGVSAAAAQTEPATVPPTSTLDNWSLTGTAMFFASTTPTPTSTLPPDWCFFLTPSPVFLPTIYVTPDAFQIAATVVLLQTGTPTQTLTPTDAPPRAWCNSYIPPSDASAMTATQAHWPTPGQLASVPPPATWTRVPAPQPVRQQQPQPPAQAAPPATDLPPQPTDPPQVIIVTSPPQVIVIPATGQVVIVTATPPNTDVPSDTPTFTATETSTDVPSATPTELPTDPPTSVPTATDMPSETPTVTATDIPTDLPTATMTPTTLPTETPALIEQVTQDANP